MKKNIFNKGFTLIELLVVILIIVILSTIAIATYSSANQSARNAKRKSDMETLRQALVMYRQEEGSYPNTNTWATMTSALQTEGYLSSDAVLQLDDPGANTYEYRGTAATFRAWATMEGTDQGNYTNTNCNTTTTPRTVYCVLNP